MFARSPFGWPTCCVAALAILPGCALVWDAPDGRRHVLGYHATVSPEPSGDAEVRALDVLGAALILGSSRSAVVLGMLRERQVALRHDAAIRIGCLDCAPDAIRPVAMRPIATDAEATEAGQIR